MVMPASAIGWYHFPYLPVVMNPENSPVSRQYKPNSITLASSELAPSMFEAGSCQIPLHYLVRSQLRTSSEQPAPN